MTARRSGAVKAPAADATLRLLTFLAAQRAPVAAVRIAEQLELPRSTVYDLLGALVARGYALHLPEERRYALGPAAYELAAGYARHDPLARLGRRAVAAMVDAVGESGHLAVLHGRDALYLVEERARRRPSLVTDAGVRLPAHLTASGRAMLAALTPAQLRSLYPSRTPFERRTEAPAVTSRAELVAALGSVRRDGVAWEDGEVTAGFASVAAAVTDHAGWPVAAVALTWPTASAATRGSAASAASTGSAASPVSAGPAVSAGPPVPPVSPVSIRPWSTGSELAARCEQAVREVAGEVAGAIGRG